MAITRLCSVSPADLKNTPCHRCANWTALLPYLKLDDGNSVPRRKLLSEHRGWVIKDHERKVLREIGKWEKRTTPSRIYEEERGP